MKINQESRRVKVTSLTVLLVSAFLLSALAGISRVSAIDYTQYTGTLNGADWALRIPNPWNGMLVLVCRGYNPGLPNVLTSLASGTAMLNSGFAVAASNYGAKGLCIFEGIDSTYQLTQYIINTYHVTGKVFLFGMSMGGCISLLLAEEYPEVYSGVLDMYGLKDLKDAYPISLKWSNLSDADLATELTKLGIPVPPPGISVAFLRSFMALVTNDTVLATGGTPATQPKAYEDRSPTYHADIEIPVITVHGTADSMVLYGQSLKYQTEVAKAGRSYLYRLYNVTGAGHGTADITAEAPAHFAELVGWSNALDAWNMTVDGRSLKAYPDLKETVWQKNATMPPNGEYDKIGLHRLVKTGITPKGVVFLTNCPMWGAGEQRISNPATDSWTKYENFSQAIYWANRGFDVYAIDYRTHFAPKGLNASQYSFAANWGLDVWVSDIKEAAEKLKVVSGADKFFISGECTGGMMALNYATKYWKTDLKGIILLDPNFLTQGYPVVGRLNETNTYNLTSAVNNMYATGNFTMDPYAGLKGIAAYALANPTAPAQFPPGTPLSPATNPATNQSWASITEWWSYVLRGLTLAGNTGNVTQCLKAIVDGEWLPLRVQYESLAMTNWVNTPYLAYDYNDHYNEIGVPLLAFDSGLFSNRTGALRFVNGINNNDFTAIMLPTYGHLDVYMGTNSARDVSQPALAWMLNELGITPKATAFSNATVMTGWTWNFFVHSTAGAGPYIYQWYEGTTLMAGQTQMVLPVTKNTPGTYTFYCKVTDSAGATANSNSVTLTVFS